MGKKKFFDKKKSATFQLLARDSSDPIYDETPGSDRVFVRVDNNDFSIDNLLSDENQGESGDSNSIFADAPEDDGDVGGDFVKQIGSRPSTGQLPDHVRREILDLGFPDDGYNYLLHLREIKNTGGGSAYYHNSKAQLDQLPLDVKAYDASRLKISEVNDNPDESAIYSVASKTVNVRVQKAVDPEVVALLDNDDDLSRFGSDVEDLEEDFIVQANLPEEGVAAVMDKNNVEGSEEIKKELEQSDTCCPEVNMAEFVGGNEVSKHLLETHNDYVDVNPRVRRLLDEQFDLIELQEYGSESDDNYDCSIAEEDESLADKLSHALKHHAVDDLELNDGKYKTPVDLLRDGEKLKNTEGLDSAADLIDRCLEYAEKYENEDVDEMVVLEESSDESDVWDCETVITTYSNLDNHPGKIEVPGISRKKKLAATVSGASNTAAPLIVLRGKEKLPVDFLPRNKKAAAEKEPAREEEKGVGSSGTEQQRKKQVGQETKEEKKERKSALKEERREARRLKKEIKGMYRCEGQRAQKVAAISGPSSIHLM